MDRRTFLQSSTAVVVSQALPWGSALASTPLWRSFEIVTRVEVAFPSGVSKAWVPLPLQEETAWHKPLANAWSGNAVRAEVLDDGKYGVKMLYAEWPTGEASPALEVKSSFMTRDRAVDLSRPDPGVKPLSAAEQKFYTAPTELIPTDGIVRKTALEATRGARTDLDKGRALYEWVVENTFRDPK
ncbi:MAG TPA: transglutaminase, partial [Burkholderiales bacterium]|nr:transglutaminase [Burkholderiales bacterium]